MPGALAYDGHALRPTAEAFRRQRLLQGRPIEWLRRDAPMLLLGEGTSEIQRTIVARGLIRAPGGRL
jgi:alkylation response protein AidB-like acyl-CoA dehydrogenase